MINGKRSIIGEKPNCGNIMFILLCHPSPMTVLSMLEFKNLYWIETHLKNVACNVPLFSL